MGRRKDGGGRVLGPYREEHRGDVRYRVIQIAADGGRETFFADTEAAANKLVKACLIDLGIPKKPVTTTTQALALWAKQKEVTQSWSKRTRERTLADVRFFALQDAEAPIGIVNVEWVRTYLTRIAHLALASQQSRFNAVTEWLTWCVKHGHLSANPCHAIDKAEKSWTGKRARRKMGRGKPQLRNVAEVKSYLAAALELDKAMDRVAAVLPLLCGLRSGEVRHLRVADIDFELGKLWVRDLEVDDDDEDDGWDVKSAAGRRTVELPEDLIPDLGALCAKRGPDDLVFQSNRGERGARERKWLARLVARVCESAGTRVVNPHGLRDTYTSLLAAVAEKSASEIAKLVGHADHGKTAKRHYIGVPEHTRSLRLVKGGEKA